MKFHALQSAKFPEHKPLKLQKAHKIIKTSGETSENKIILAIRENPTLTQKELAEEVGLSYAGIRYVMDKLKKQGKLKRIGSTKNGQWEITEGLR